MVSILVLLWLPVLAAQTVPPGWKLVRDGRGACQIAVPPEWVPLEGSAGASVLGNSSTAIAVVTSQPGQEFRPLTESLHRLLGVPKDRMFENSTKRVFYQDKLSRNQDDSNAFSASVGMKGGTCSCRVTALPSLPLATVKAIVLSLGPSAVDVTERPQLHGAEERGLARRRM